MTATKYTYTIATDFPYAKVAPDRLTYEIQHSDITVALDRIETGNGICDIWFADVLSTPGVNALSALVSVHSGIALPDPLTADGIPRVALQSSQNDKAGIVALVGRRGRETTYATHSFCDKTTWSLGSTRVTGESLTDSAGTWSGANAFWIDLTHGKVMDEEGVVQDQQILEPGNPHGYEVSVTVNGTPKIARAPFETSGGDYTIDYVAGTITPVSEDWTGMTVLASYSYANSSVWRLPPIDKALVVEKAEIQFSEDIVFSGTMRMVLYGYVQHFAPSLAVSNGGPVPDNTPIPLSTTLYKTVDQLIDEALQAYPVIPAISGSNGRGFSSKRIIFQFHYAAVKTLYPSLGMYIEFSIDGDSPLGGERATATFYCVSEEDPGVTEALVLVSG